MELKSVWRALPGPGPVENEVFIENKSGDKVVFPPNYRCNANRCWEHRQRRRRLQEGTALRRVLLRVRWQDPRGRGQSHVRRDRHYHRPRGAVRQGLRRTMASNGRSGAGAQPRRYFSNGVVIPMATVPGSCVRGTRLLLACSGGVFEWGIDRNLWHYLAAASPPGRAWACFDPCGRRLVMSCYHILAYEGEPIMTPDECPAMSRRKWRPHSGIWKTTRGESAMRPHGRRPTSCTGIRRWSAPASRRSYPSPTCPWKSSGESMRSCSRTCPTR